jgi:hypothetical protein
MQQVRINILDAQVLKRAVERLLDLDWNWGLRVVGQTMILPGAEGKLGLQEQIASGRQAALNGGFHGTTHRRLVVVPPLVSGVDAAKSLLQRRCG